MLKLSHPITSINGFKIGDRVRLKDGDGRPHIIKSFSVDGIKEFFFEVQFEDGTDAMLDNIAPLISDASLPSNLDEAAIDAAQLDMQDRQIMEATNDEILRYSRIFRRGFKAGAEWMAGQGESRECTIGMATKEIHCILRDGDMDAIGIGPGDKVVVQIRKKD